MPVPIFWRYLVTPSSGKCPPSRQSLSSNVAHEVRRYTSKTLFLFSFAYSAPSAVKCICLGAKLPLLLTLFLPFSAIFASLREAKLVSPSVGYLALARKILNPKPILCNAPKDIKWKMTS